MPGTTVTPLALSALALLAERPMHPYEMYQVALQRRDDRLVKIRPGTLYHAVSRLVEDGLLRAVGTDREGRRPERTTYDITDAGRDVLQTSIADQLAEVATEYPVFPFALSTAHELPTPDVVILLEQRLSALQGMMAEVESGIAGVRAKDLPWAYWLHLDYQHATLSAEVTWLEGALADIKAGQFAVPAHHQPVKDHR